MIIIETGTGCNKHNIDLSYDDIITV